MNRQTERRVEEMLRGGAPSARRDPSADLRARVVAVIGSDETTGRRESPPWPAGPPAWRGRLGDMAAAASVLIAVGLWTLAFLRVSPNGASLAPAPGAGVLSAVEDSTAPSAIAQLARATPGNLKIVIDDSLFGELENIVEDATRAARFVVGRVPASLVARATSDTER